MIVPAQTYFKVWGALLALLLLTIGVAFVNLGPFNLPVALGIAVIKALLIVRIFMHIKGGAPVLHVAAVAGVLWLSILLGLTMNDYVTRHAVTWLPK